MSFVIMSVLYAVQNLQVKCTMGRATDARRVTGGKSAVLTVSKDRVIGGLAHAEDVKTAFGEPLAQYVTVHVRIRHVIMRQETATRAQMGIGDKLVPVSAVINAKRAG